MKKDDWTNFSPQIDFLDLSKKGTEITAAASTKSNKDKRKLEAKIAIKLLGN